MKLPRQREPHLVGYELVTGQPGPVQGVFAFFYPLFRRVSAIVKADYPYGWIAEVGHDVAHPGEQLSLMPLHLGHHSSGNIPALGLTDEVMIGDDGPLGRPLGGPCQQVRYFPLKYLVGWKPDAIADIFRFQVLVKLRLGKGGVPPKQQPQPTLQVTLDDRIDESLPTISAMNIPGS